MGVAPRGIITVLNTPFTSSDAIDLAGLRKNVADAMEAGVTGFLVPAMASEAGSLRPSEKRELVCAVIDQVNREAVVIGGTSAPTHSKRMKLAAEWIELGCDGLLVPLDPTANFDTWKHELCDLAAFEPELLMAQDWDAKGTGIPVESIIDLFNQIDRFNWLKIEVLDAGAKYSEVLERTKGELNVAGGWAVTEMIDGLDRGVHAFMPTAMHQIYVIICERYSNGDRDGAIELFDRIKPVLDFSNQSLPTSLRFFKRLLHAQGVFATPNVRAAGSPFTPDQARIADDLIRTVIEIQHQLSDPSPGNRSCSS